MTKEDISRIIKESRTMAGLTQTQVAEKLGRPQATIAGWEVGRSQPDANTLFELFRVLGRSVDEAFGFSVESFNVTARERTHIEKYRFLAIGIQGAVSSVLESEYKRCMEQNLADYGSRLDQIGEEIKRIQKNALESDERTLDDVTEETRRLESLTEELSEINRNYRIAIDTMESTLAAMRAPQPSPAPQKGKDTTPAADGPETPQEGAEGPPEGE